MRLFEGTQFDVPPRCDHCRELESDCRCKTRPDPSIPPEKQSAQIAVEKRKRGKTMTVVRGLADDRPQLANLLSMLKSRCGGGGTIKDGAIEIQGSHADRIAQILSDAGYKIR